jgi:hypothetical protein
MQTVVGEPVVAAPPHRDRWDYGGYQYGLEPLTLPAKVALGAEGATPAVGPELLQACEELRQIAGNEPAMTIPSGTGDQLFWFRWITGHQVTFSLWQLLARAMDNAAHAPDLAQRDEALRRASRYIEGYSAMLLYCASCPRDVYTRVIRPSMYLQHPAFSGSWARDFGPVKAVLRGKVRPVPVTDEVSRLMATQSLNARIHDGIAAKLVPDSPSLLVTAATSGRLSNRGVHGVLYDNYFMTLRATVSPALVVAQLLRRLHALGRDLSLNGLYPPWASSAQEKPAGLTDETVILCEASVPGLLYELAVAATEEP